MFRYVTKEGSARACTVAAAAACKKEFRFLTPESSALVPIARALRKKARLPTESFLAQHIFRQSLPPKKAKEVDFENVTSEVTKLYEPKRYAAVIVGAPNGGVAHLSALLHAPFFSTHFLFSFQDRTLPDDVATYFQHGRELAREVLKQNRNVSVVNHYDPIHDRFYIAQVNHIRVKARRLPEAYKEFILEHLSDGGTVIFSDCQYPWLQIPVENNLTFQIGGLGGYSPQDFLQGDKSFPSQGFPEKGWSLPDWPLIECAESEWGSSLEEEEVRTFCEQFGFQFVSLKYPHPEDYSRLALDLYERVLERSVLALPEVLWIDCFNLLNPTCNLLTSTPAYWLPFHTKDSLHSLQELLKHRPHYSAFYLTLLPTLNPSADLAPLSAWIHTLASVGVCYLIGVEKERFPVDFAGPLRYPLQVRRFARQFFSPLLTRATVDDFFSVLASA